MIIDSIQKNLLLDDGNNMVLALVDSEWVDSDIILLRAGIHGGHTKDLTNIERLDLLTLHEIPDTDRGITGTRNQVLMIRTGQDTDLGHETRVTQAVGLDVVTLGELTDTDMFIAIRSDDVFVVGGQLLQSGTKKKVKKVWVKTLRIHDKSFYSCK